ncbi:uncharacterized protein LOC106169280 [Lingula anatina]|uniref:Uncharacterized protein LOC106169280 n=1 Tax=Lingula anatina TaxID=7574 RepID=A0A1S3J129_LINAN|nr:uncharacterized protein LOC106169280 [Lingula anatina]|eukprot:XP_013404145.1 uncharacterized protein LOC106169280 [Lingula anatina]
MTELPYPVGWWPLESSYKGTDVTGNGNHATLSSELYPTQGPFGGKNDAYALAGTINSHIVIPNNGKLDVRYSYTFTAYFMPKGGNGPLFDYDTDDPSHTWGFHIWNHADPNNLGVYHFDRSFVNRGSTSVSFFADSVWSHLAITYDYASNQVFYYRNGVLVHSWNPTQQELATAGSKIRIGYKPYDNGANYLTKGRISCIKLYNVALSQHDIKRTMRRCTPEGSTELDTHPLPVGWWPLDAAHGSHDVTGHGNEATMSGLTYVTGPHGDNNGAVRLAGSMDSYIELPNNGYLDTRFSQTFMAWINIDSTTTTAPVFQFDFPTQADGWGYLAMWLHPDTNSYYVAFRRRTDGWGNEASATHGSYFLHDQWIHVAVTYDYTTGVHTVYRDGELFGTNSVGQYELSTQYFVRIGAKNATYNDHRFLKADISCVKLYDVALSEYQIKKAMDICSPENILGFTEGEVQPRPVGMWHLNQQYGANDVSGNENHGIVGSDVTYAPGPKNEPNGAFVFCNTADCNVTIPQNLALDVRRSMTWSVDMYPEDSSTNMLFLSWKMVGGNTAHGPHFYVQQDNKFGALLHKRIDSAGSTQGSSATSPSVLFERHKWVSLAFTYDQDTGIGTLWMDGEVKFSADFGQWDLGTQYDLLIGTGTSATHRFIGRMSCLQLYDVALSRSQIITGRQLCQLLQGFPNPVAFWPLETRYHELDLSGNGNNIMKYGVTPAKGLKEEDDGSIGFPTDSYIEVSNNGSLDIRYSFTFLGYVYSSSSSTEGPIFNFEHENASSGGFGTHVMQIGNTDILVRLGYRDGTLGPWYNVSGVLDVDTWTYIGWTYSFGSGMAVIYKNGYEVASSYFGSVEHSTMGALRMGKTAGDSRSFTGRLKCMQLYDRALNSTEVKKSMNICGSKEKSAQYFKSPVAPGRGLPGFLALSTKTTSSLLRCTEFCNREITASLSTLRANPASVRSHRTTRSLTEHMPLRILEAITFIMN